MFRLGIDIGGTFTDASLVDAATGEMWIGKRLSTPDSPADAFVALCERVLQDAEAKPDELAHLVHATTVATNAIIEGRTARTGFITTDGFRDMLEIARQSRPSLYDLQFVKPPPLVARHLCVGVQERLDADGQVVKDLNEDDAARAIAYLLSEKVEAIAVCLLHAYANPAHERRIGELIQKAAPNLPFSLSADVAPEFREYYRASTTIINAALRPRVATYLGDIDRRLRAKGIGTEVLVMQSSGGVYSAQAARVNPVYMVESGPAAGVMAATFIGTAVGRPNVISFDMGGTTAKVGLIQAGVPRITREYEVGTTASAGKGEHRGSGYPIRTPVVDLVEIGSGGGSIAWVDSGGALRVGPRSAGADPGPACYGGGGDKPTVTDANLVLGRLNPDFFLGGAMKLNVDAAAQAIEQHCGRPLGLETIETALAIVEVANAAMINALRLISIQRGYDPRDFTLVAFGGAGPAHANRLAMETGMATTLIPRSPGIASALGLLVTDLSYTYSRTVLKRTEDIDCRALSDAFLALEEQGRTSLVGTPSSELYFRRVFEMRYVGQSYELDIVVDEPEITPDVLKSVVSRFHNEHERAYGSQNPVEPVEVVNITVTAIGEIAKPHIKGLSGQNGTGSVVELERTRPVYFAESAGFVQCPVLDRQRLRRGDLVIGPAIVEELDSTVVVHPDFVATVDRNGNLVIERAAD